MGIFMFRQLDICARNSNVFVKKSIKFSVSAVMCTSVFLHIVGSIYFVTKIALHMHAFTGLIAYMQTNNG